MCATASFITSASGAFATLCEQFDRADRAVAGLKRYLGETLLGWSADKTTEEDSWQSFFVLMTKFAVMYKAALVDLEEWKRAENRHQRKISLGDIKSEGLALRKRGLSSADTATGLATIGGTKQTEKSALLAAKRESMKRSEDALQAFKDKVLSLRKKANTMDLDVDSSDTDEDEW